MADDNWLKAKEIFLSALETAPEERDALIRDSCGGDGSIEDEVRSLLASHESAEDFIEVPAFSVESAFSDTSALIGRQFGSYTVVSEIGHGGMGAVFLAERTDGEYRNQVAIKIVRPGLDTGDVRRRFIHERQILADLEHPCIARLIDGGTTADGLPFLVMEYVEGEPITQFAKKLSLGDRLRLFQKVCGAVAHAHRSLVIHRDLKPSNIFVTPDGEPKLLDFGIAKLLDSSGSAGQTLTNFGAFTPDYASPEQIKGGPITTASDVYSLGVVLYEMLTGASPYRFETRSPDELIRVICVDSPSSPSRSLRAAAADPKVSPDALAGDLENIVLMALRKEPDRRYSSVEQFSNDIQRHLDGLPVMAREDTVGYRASKFIRRHRYGVAMTSALAILLVAGIVTTTWQARVAREERDIAEAEKAKAEKINKFLQQMLSYSNQSWSSATTAGKGRDVTINEMLGDIAPKLESELADQPDVRARILRTIAEAYHSQGQFPLAEKYLREALEIDRQLYGDDHLETMKTRTELAVSLYQVGKNEEAESIFSDVVGKLRLRIQASPNDVEKYLLAGALHGLGTMKLVNSGADDAIPLMREAVGVTQGLDLTTNERGLLAEIRLNLGAALITKGDLDESENQLRQSLDIFRSLPGNPRWEMGVTLSKLGDCLVRKKSFSEADVVLREGEAIYRNTIGEANNYLARNLNDQAFSALEQGDLTSAMDKARSNIELLERTASPPGRSLLARAYSTLGSAMCGSREFTKGGDLLRKSVEMYQAIGATDAANVEAKLASCTK